MRPILLIVFFQMPVAGMAQTTWYVPDDFTRIQGAFNSASVVNGDTIIVRPGTYAENVDFLGKAVTLQSEQGAGVTTIDGGQIESVVTFENGEGLGSVLDGFTITNGAGQYGGGVCCLGNASPTISNNTISGNSATDQGGGISFIAAPVIQNNLIKENQSYYGGGVGSWGGSATLSENTIMDNTASYMGGGIFCNGGLNVTGNIISTNQAGEGGGIYFGFVVDGRKNGRSKGGSISNNTITGNTVTHYGGGIQCFDTNPDITHNYIAGNEADLWGGGICYDDLLDDSGLISGNVIMDNTSGKEGGGVFCMFNFTPLITNNTFIRNTAAEEGGGIYSYSDSVIVNNTFSDNRADKGGGILCAGYDTTISNTILWNNEAIMGKELYVIGGTTHSLTITINHSDVEDGLESVHVKPNATLLWGHAMIDADPLFVNPAGDDFHLTRLSPCINRGTNVGAPALDIDGDTRPHMGTVDMGSDEFTGKHLFEADLFTLPEAGGTVQFDLNAGPSNANRNYLILGSITGTAPGSILPGGLATVPIEWDFFTTLVILWANSPIFSNFLGPLDGGGSSTASLNLPGVPGAAGIVMSYAYTLNNPWDFASNPIQVELVL